MWRSRSERQRLRSIVLHKTAYSKYYHESKKHSKQPMYPSVPLLSVMQLQHKPDYTTEMTCGYRTILCFSSCSTSTDSSKKLLQQPGNQMNVRRFKLS
ncbi:hypothetical protein PPTG_13169 [Phytophthora nicotianae INRA-310]|uniref:Uncharacterized protein n=1 Tax=Phytophthora nicotianae (strain INRA-310) TaxID=761204 RepID=W2Q0I4_PHYN3|nr:hypothetical protein PPTG_13169 [Phytophthora nicotianae INRA-310]ETN05780.1 hypothetical protein PPTG_13169 [Phytophthora nicotianae INRA-310]